MNSEDVLAVEELDTTFAKEVCSQPGGENLRRCFACGTCTASCPVTDVDEDYNCRRLIRQILYGMRKEVLSSPFMWYCAVCYRCTARCPQKVNFADVMRVLRHMAVKEGHVSGKVSNKIEEIDRLSQEIRLDLVKFILSGDKRLVKKAKSRLEKLS